MTNDKSVCVNSQRVVCEVEADHLGYRIYSKDKESNVKAAICGFWMYYNLFIAEFGQLYGFLKCRLFKQCCYSFYGSPLWGLDSKGVESLCITWRKSLRLLWRLHPMTHKDTITAISDVLPLALQLNKRIVNFYEKCKRNSNCVVQCIMQVYKKSPMSPFGKNIRKYAQVDVMYKDWFSRRDIINDVNVIRELLEVRGNLKSVYVLN